MKKLKYLLFPISITLISSAYTIKQLIPTISEEEAFKYEKQYLAEYENIKQNNSDYKYPFSWVQPKNKKEECKVYVSINPDDNKTLKSDYALYWDGECKYGYASGLGREIEKTALMNSQQIGFYENGMAIDYCTIINTTEKWSADGECAYLSNKTNHRVITYIDGEQSSLDIGTITSKNSLSMFAKVSLVSNVITYIKEYPNFKYVIFDYAKNEFSSRNYEFNVKNKQNGYSFFSTKEGEIFAGEFINGTLIKGVQLPQSYINHTNSILNEIKKEVNLALKAQEKALDIKEKYKNKICKDSVKVDFMDNSEYKDICNEDKKFAKIRDKISLIEDY